MERIFKIRKIGEWMIVERLKYPRLRLFVSVKAAMPEFIKVTLLEKCPASAFADALKEINACFGSFTMRGNYN